MTFRFLQATALYPVLVLPHKMTGNSLPRGWVFDHRRYIRNLLVEMTLTLRCFAEDGCWTIDAALSMGHSGLIFN